MSEAQKDTVYVDIDDEITSIIEKINGSKSKIVALVLPKRAVVLQSIVNMKLIKRASDEAGKRIVLITSEQGILPLAGAVGVYVAKNLQSKPEIPVPLEEPQMEDELLETDDSDDTENQVDNNATVGELSGDNSDAIFENDAPQESTIKDNKKKPKSSKDKTKSKKNKIPNFDSFRKKVLIGVTVVISLIVLAYISFFVLPKATVIIKTETSTTNNSIDFTASPKAQTIDIEKSIVPSKEVEANKTETQKAPTTGQKDLGTKANGNVTLSIPCGSVSGSPPTVPAGTGISNNGLTFITASSVSLTTPNFIGGCKFTGNTNVTAQANGEQYNLSSGKTFTVAGFSSITGSNSEAFTGGTTKMAKVVSQQDVDTAKQKLTDNSSEVKNELQKQLESAGYYAITDTFTTKSEKITSTPDIDQEATEVSVTADRVYVMTGVKKEDLNSLIQHSVQSELDKRSLQIQNNGLDQAIFRIGSRKEDGTTAITMQVQVVLGPNINEDKLKQDIAGKKRGDVQAIVKNIDGVQSAEIKFSPFWVNVVPKDPNKITINYEKANN